MTYAGRSYWDGYFKKLRAAGSDLDWGGRWTEPFVPLLRSSQAQRVLELGCGTGNDAARLAHAGFEVVALDLSPEAIAQARNRHGQAADFIVADVAEGLAFPSGSFDAVMANVSLHMFSDAVTRAILAEVGRVLGPGGLLLLHVNADDDRPLRARRRPVARELEPDYVLEEAGQTVRFFSREYLTDLLRTWEIVTLEHVELDDQKTGEPFKRVWRVAACRPAAA
jgi:SAM-dependent methyltransferase